MDWEGWLAVLLPPAWAAAPPRKAWVTDALVAEVRRIYDADYYLAGQRGLR